MLKLMISKKIIFFIALFLSLFTNTILAQNNNFQLKQGDLLFQDVDCGVFCDAIEKVTFGFKGSKFSHIGFVVFDSIADDFLVIEAVSSGVKKTSLQNFLNRSHDKNNNPKVVVGRIKNDFKHLIPKAVYYADKLIGKTYDDVFDINNDKYYCSELIYKIFYQANNNSQFFELQPMTYKDPDTEKYFKIWVDYFNDLKTPIPEGKPGINPGLISRSKNIDIVYKYGIVDVGKTE